MKMLLFLFLEAFLLFTHYPRINMWALFFCVECKEEAQSCIVVSDIQNATGDIISRKNNRATGYLDEEQ